MAIKLKAINCKSSARKRRVSLISTSLDGYPFPDPEFFLRTPLGFRQNS
jgi:hypothetical protein